MATYPTTVREGLVNRIKNYFELQLEIRRLSASKTIISNYDPPELVDIERNRPIWRIFVPGQPDIFMKSLRINEYIVYVNTEAFYLIWLRSKTKNPADCILRARMKQDVKYHYADDGFSCGRENPVPIASPSIWLEKNKPRIDLSDGVTRTFWLIANRAASFPVAVRTFEEAVLLNKWVGIGQPIGLPFTF